MRERGWGEGCVLPIKHGKDRMGESENQHNGERSRQNMGYDCSED